MAECRPSDRPVLTAMTAWYNENDPATAEWLRRLVRAGQLPEGEVDDRDFREVCADDVRGDGQRHFFAGVGGWAISAQTAGWPDDIPLWTSSLPCQPWSQAGRVRGEDDPRDLWPPFLRLIEECEPPVLVGEQVAGRLGARWCARLRDDLETRGYAVGVVGAPATVVEAPHRRERYWWLAHSGSLGLSAHPDLRKGNHASPGGPVSVRPDSQAHAQREIRPWREARVLECPDGGRRRIPVEPAFRPLAHGFPDEVVRLRAYGNAIVPALGRSFLEAALEVVKERLR